MNQMSKPDGIAHTPTPWRIDSHFNSIYADNVPKGPMRVADIRGWGYLTGKGDGALGLDYDAAFEIQKANAAFIVKSVNAMPDVEFLLDRLAEFDPGEDDAEREYHGHVAPAIARLRNALAYTE
jgi:hypothetical protein